MGRPNVIVVGGGTIGTATAWALAERGAAVTVLERHHHVHELGSHGGYTRAIRHAYHEGSGYVPLVLEADRLWLELGKRRREDLLVRTGLLEFGSDTDADYTAAVSMCRAHDLEHEVLDARAAKHRWPFEIPNDWSACFTPSGGYLRVQSCLDALRDEAVHNGATFRERAHVVQIEPEADGVRVRLASGEELRAELLVASPGTGLPELVTRGLPPLRRMRRALVWTRPAEQHRPALSRLPVWGAFVPEGFFYGFPWNSEGVDGLKFACHQGRPPGEEDLPVDPHTIDRNLLERDAAPLQAFVRRYFPLAGTAFVDHRICTYTTTHNWDFVIDRWSASDRVVIAGGFSGHGFKFAPSLGQRIARMLLDGADGPPEFALAAHMT